MYDPASGEAGAKGAREERKIGVPEVLDYFGVPPEKVIDVQALAGDSTDHVPGARGIGVKTAAQLIGEYGDLDTLLARASEIKQPKRREILTEAESVALIKLSKQLVTLVRDVPLDVPLDELGLHAPDPKTLVAFLKAMEFTTITKRAAEFFGVAAEAIEPDPAFVGAAAWRGRNGEAAATTADAPQAAATGPAIEATAAPAGPRKNARYGEPIQRQVVATGPGELAAGARRGRHHLAFRSRRLCHRNDLRSARSRHRCRFRGGPRCNRHRDLVARCDEYGADRHLALRRPGAGLLHSSAP